VESNCSTHGFRDNKEIGEIENRQACAWYGSRPQRIWRIITLTPISYSEDPVIKIQGAFLFSDGRGSNCVGVDHGGPDVAVPQKLLYGA